MIEYQHEEVDSEEYFYEDLLQEKQLPEYVPINIPSLARQALIDVNKSISDSVVKHCREMTLKLPAGVIKAEVNVEQLYQEYSTWDSPVVQRSPTRKLVLAEIECVKYSEVWADLVESYKNFKSIALEKYFIPGDYFAVSCETVQESCYGTIVGFKLQRVY